MKTDPQADEFLLSNDNRARAYGRLLATGSRITIHEWTIAEHARGTEMPEIFMALIDLYANLNASLIDVTINEPAHHKLAEQIGEGVTLAIKGVLKCYKEEPQDA